MREMLIHMDFYRISCNFREIQYNKTNFESSHRQPGGLIMASKINKGEILAKFFDDGEYTALLLMAQ